MIKKFEQYVSKSWDLNPEYDYDQGDVPIRKKRQHDDVIEHIIEALEKTGFNEKNLNIQEYSYRDTKEWNYSFTIDNRIFNELDPYGEEDWGEKTPKKINFKIELNTKTKDVKFVLNIPTGQYGTDSIELDVSKYLIFKILNFFEKDKIDKKLRSEEDSKRLKDEKIRKAVFGE